ncbi:hypothetical protein LOTGIDRAFT_154760 [Lottia gigantea]|uniref:Uncharacterized protein n=1 Tax=Lottia gigantea TaxID=225164 RepID=V3Z8L4_LOTGI|nr:hypothetical protein LOTGIDRAFT_154760 [Lottia gigantea]ESO87258.1 hypothetical protein LOTGIDRAFT_154760 [Lottia gigantea]
MATNRKIKKQTLGLGKSWKHVTESKLSDQDAKLLLSVKQLVEKTLEQSHETRFKGANLDSMKKYNFDINVPTGAISKLGIKLTRKQSVDETRLAIRKIDIHDHSLVDCKRQQPIVGLYKNNKKDYCDLFGPGLCPDCVQVSDQVEFTQKQEKVYPQITVNTDYMIAGGKLTKKKTQTTSKGIVTSPFNRQVDLEVLDGVVTDEAIHRRLKEKYTAQDQLAVESVLNACDDLNEDVDE